MKLTSTLMLALSLMVVPPIAARERVPPPESAADADPSAPSADHGRASWYGEAHRGRLMANGAPFDPTHLTAASWFYPLGTKVRVRVAGDPNRCVEVTITDRGPARRLVGQGRIIDLSRAAFERLADPAAGLINVEVTALD